MNAYGGGTKDTMTHPLRRDSLHRGKGMGWRRRQGQDESPPCFSGPESWVKEVFSTRTEEEGCSTSFIHIRRQRNNRRTRAKKKVRDERREAFLFPSCLWTLKKGILSRLNHDWSTSSLTHSRITLCRIWTRRPTFYRFQIQLSRIRKTVPWLPPDQWLRPSFPADASFLSGSEVLAPLLARDWEKKLIYLQIFHQSLEFILDPKDKRKNWYISLNAHFRFPNIERNERIR